MRRYARNQSTPITVQRTPRAASRLDRPALALSDAGHGADPATQNPILYGLGATLVLRTNAYVRTFRVWVRAFDPDTSAYVQEEITANFIADAAVPGRHKLSGQAGVFPLAPSTMLQDDFSAPQRIEFIITTRNASLEVTQRTEMWVVDDFPLARCPDAEDCDFALMQPISKAGVRIFENLVDRAASENAPVSFFFGQLDALLAKVPTLSSVIPNYSADASVGVEFTNDGEMCGGQSVGGTPPCAALYCCCEIRGELVTYTLNDITTPSLNPITSGSSVNINDVIEIVATVPTTAAADCVGFDSLVVALPGLDTTGGYFSLYDPIQVGGFLPTVTRNGSPIVPSFSQHGIDGGDGSGHVGLLDFSAIPIICGDVIVITFRMRAVLMTSTVPVSMGALAFSDGGPCNPSGTAPMPLLGVGSGLS